MDESPPTSSIDPDVSKETELDLTNRRSRRYVPLTDEEIIQHAMKKDLNQRDQEFLSREIDYRDLNLKVKAAKNERTRAIYKKPIWKILALVFIAVFALSRQMNRLF